MKANIYEIISGTNEEMVVNIEHQAEWESDEEFQKRILDAYDGGAMRVEFE